MMCDVINHLVPWTTVKKLLKGAWAEGYDAKDSDMGAEQNGVYRETPNPYDKEGE